MAGFVCWSAECRPTTRGVQTVSLAGEHRRGRQHGVGKKKKMQGGWSLVVGLGGFVFLVVLQGGV